MSTAIEIHDETYLKVKKRKLRFSKGKKIIHENGFFKKNETISINPSSGESGAAVKATLYFHFPRDNKHVFSLLLLRKHR